MRSRFLCNLKKCDAWSMLENRERGLVEERFWGINCEIDIYSRPSIRDKITNQQSKIKRLVVVNQPHDGFNPLLAPRNRNGMNLNSARSQFPSSANRRRAIQPVITVEPLITKNPKKTRR